MPAARKLTKSQETKLERLLKRGTPRSQIAKELKLPPSTLGDILRRRAAQATPEPPTTGQAVADGIAEEDYRADEEPPEVDQGTPAIRAAGNPPEATEITEVHYTAEDSPQEVYISPPLQEMAVAWPAMQRMLAWWEDRERTLQEPAEPLERVTYHVSPRWIAAVRREADQTGESYAAVVNRALTLYFTRET
jgi:hypothetical protein